MAPRASDSSRRGAAGLWAHRLAVVTATATAVLIFVGGVVTNTGSGLAVPDWPTTFGQNMFLYPPSEWVEGILYEHSHRLLGALVGLLTIGLAVVLWLAAPRSRVRWLGVAAVAAVMAQGILGGLRVVLLKQTLAMVHGMAAQAFFALVVGLAVVTSSGWRAAPRSDLAAAPRDSLRRLSLLATGVFYFQAALGSVVTHTGAQLTAHLVTGGVAALLALWLAAHVLREHWDRPWLARPVRILGALVIVQLFLGLGSYLGRFTALGAAFPPAVGLAFPIVHRLVGALLVGTSVVLTLRVHRLPGAREAAPGGAHRDPTRGTTRAVSGRVAA